MILSLSFYGSLAIVALWASWRDDDLRWVGLAICFSFIASNLTWFFMATVTRPGVYTMCEIFISLTTYMAWHELRYKILIAIVMVSALSICANVALSLQLQPVWTQIHTHEMITNVCFVLECLLTFGAGVMHGVRTGRFNLRLGLRNRTRQHHGHWNKKP